MKQHQDAHHPYSPVAEAPAPGADATRPSELREALRGKSYAEGKAMLEPAKAPAPGGGAKAKAEGAEAAPAAEAGQEQAPAADVAPGAEAAPAGAEALSPIRLAILEQFQLLEGKGVGDAEFDRVCSAAAWKAQKDREAKELAEKGRTAVYTTCIDTQNAILRAAFAASELAIKKNDKGKESFNFGTVGRKEGQKLGAWTEASAPLSARPKVGDILVLEKQGTGVDNAHSSIAFSESQFQKKEAQLQQQLAALEAAAEGATEAKAAANAARVSHVEAQLDKLRAQHERTAAFLRGKLDEARARRDALNSEENRKKGGGLAFSHVGCLKRITKQVVDGQETGLELWETFDGGQTLGGGKNGARTCTRLYDPRTNEISGEMSQGGALRWLAGWVDVDALVEPAKQEEGAAA